MLIYEPARFSTLQDFADAAAVEYSQASPLLSDAFSRFKALLETLLTESRLPYQSLRGRRKDDCSFRLKAAKPNPSYPMRPKYECPSQQIEDQIGFRIVTYLQRDVKAISHLVKEEFSVVSTEDKSTALIASRRFGYQSIHHVVKLRPNRACMTENRRFANIKIEVQIRTILQDAWAEIEHNIGYKPEYEPISLGLERRFLTLAGVLEMVDNEFERIKGETASSVPQLSHSVTADEACIEMTPSSLGVLINSKFGDGELDQDVLVASASIVRALGYPTISSLSEGIDSVAETREFHALSVDYSDPVMRLYITLAVRKGVESLRNAIGSVGAQSPSWDSFFASVSAAVSASSSPST